jgi:hypothetical protein
MSGKERSIVPQTRKPRTSGIPLSVAFPGPQLPDAATSVRIIHPPIAPDELRGMSARSKIQSRVHAGAPR